MKTIVNFIKYPKIINHFAITELKNAVKIINEDWYATEKLDGTNINIHMDWDEELLIGKRTSAFKTKDQILYPYDLLDTFVAEHAEDLKSRLKQVLVDKDADSVHVYGEMIGQNIQKGSNYNFDEDKTYDVKLFEMMYVKDNALYVVNRTDLDHYLHDYVLPIVSVKTLRELIDQNVDEDKSAFNGNFEGYVYKPYDLEYAIGNGIGKYLALKHKTEKYQEVKKSKRQKQEFSQAQLYLNEDVSRYVTKERINHVLAAENLVLEMKNFGPIIKAVVADITDEYPQENDVSEYTEEQLKKAYYHQNRNIALTLKEMIKEQTKDLLNEV